MTHCAQTQEFGQDSADIISRCFKAVATDVTSAREAIKQIACAMATAAVEKLKEFQNGRVGGYREGMAIG